LRYLDEITSLVEHLTHLTRIVAGMFCRLPQRGKMPLEFPTSFALAIRSVLGLFSPRPTPKVTSIRSAARPERHFADSFTTVRHTIARILIGWLPRCPAYHRPSSRDRASPTAPALP
jgi:hypothetical protein